MHKDSKMFMRRCVARGIDLSIAACLVYPTFDISVTEPVIFLVVVALVLIPLEVFQVVAFDRTVGKFVMMLKVVSCSSGKANISEKLKRAILVWLLGEGLGIGLIIPLHNVIFIYYWERDGIAPWDTWSNTKIVAV